MLKFQDCFLSTLTNVFGRTSWNLNVKSTTNDMIRILVGLLIVVSIFIPAIYAYGTDTTTTCKVDFKERIVEDSDSKYLIYCENEVFENTDSFWYWKWDSSDVYRDLKEGKTYTIKVFGWRIPFLSMYRNITDTVENSDL